MATPWRLADLKESGFKRILATKDVRTDTERPLHASYGPDAQLEALTLYGNPYKHLGAQGCLPSRARVTGRSNSILFFCDGVDECVP